MEIVLEIPDDVAPFLGTSVNDLSREALEAFALQAYKNKRITDSQLRRLLGFSTRYQLDGFLKQHNVWLDYSEEDLQRDLDTHRRLDICR